MTLWLLRPVADWLFNREAEQCPRDHEADARLARKYGITHFDPPLDPATVKRLLEEPDPFQEDLKELYRLYNLFLDDIGKPRIEVPPEYQTPPRTSTEDLDP